MMRDAKITQIYEGTNQIQRMVKGSAAPQVGLSSENPPRRSRLLRRVSRFGSGRFWTITDLAVGRLDVEPIKADPARGHGHLTPGFTVQMIRKPRGCGELLQGPCRERRTYCGCHVVDRRWRRRPNRGRRRSRPVAPPPRSPGRARRAVSPPGFERMPANPIRPTVSEHCASGVLRRRGGGRCSLSSIQGHFGGQDGGEGQEHPAHHGPHWFPIQTTGHRDRRAGGEARHEAAYGEWNAVVRVQADVDKRDAVVLTSSPSVAGSTLPSPK